MRKLTLLFSFLLAGINAFSLDQFTISGYVRDAQSGEGMIGATVFVKELPSTGITTNAYGFYSLTIPKGTYSISAQFVGYAPLGKSIILNQNQKVDFELKEKATELGEVLVTAEKAK